MRVNVPVVVLRFPSTTILPFEVTYKFFAAAVTLISPMVTFKPVIVTLSAELIDPAPIVKFPVAVMALPFGLSIPEVKSIAPAALKLS